MSHPSRRRWLRDAALGLLTLLVLAGGWYGMRYLNEGRWTFETRPVPPFVLEQAKRYEAAHAVLARYMPGGMSIADLYVEEFRRGFEAPVPTGSEAAEKSDDKGPPGSEVYADAATAGAAWRRDHPADTDAVMAGFGYRHVSAKGVWKVGYEVNAFTPGDGSGEVWWLDAFGNAAWPHLAAAKDPSGMGLSVDGYVSPKGRYGHIGGYDREILVIVATPR